MAKYYCVLFDADNTLLNFDAAESKALAETLVNYGIEPDAETVQTYRTINSELWRQLEKGQIKREKLMAERFTRFLKAIDAAGDGAEMNRFYLEQLSTHPDLMGPEVLDVLRELSEVATLAVVTNGFQKVQIRRLAESGVLNFMEDVFVSEKMDSEKPNRRIFDAALRALGVENREHVLVVGDGLSSDIQGGVNAGLDTCWYNPSHAENPGKVVQVQEHLGALAEALAGKGARSVCNARAVGEELPAGRLTRVISEQLDLQHVRVSGNAELFLERLHRKAHLMGETALDHGRGIAARLVQKMHSFWLGYQVVEVALTAHGEIVHTDSFHRCWQGHRASWPVGVGIVEPTLYPDSG